VSREREERPAPLSAALSDAAALLTGEDGASRTFVGALIVGAFVGAALAGASLVRTRGSAPTVLGRKPKG